MSYYSYTVLECTNPELISYGSTFVKESNSKLLDIIKGKSHFLTRKGTMDEEIIWLSLCHTGETLNAAFHWDEDYCDRIIYFLEYKNGECRELAIKPGYVFIGPENQNFNKEDFSAFKDHVIKYLERLDLVKEKDGKFKIDKLNNEKDQHGYESYITITYENDLYKWTATKKWISWIEVTCEKKEPIVDPLKEFEDKLKDNENPDYFDLPL